MKHWIQAARLRTLPLSISGIILGSLIALSEDKWNWSIFTLAILTTLFLQILSNYANDYGDGIRGTDKDRIGEKRAIASGDITPKQMKKAIILMSAISFVSAFALIYISFKTNFLWILIFISLTIAAVWAAIKYTVGKNAYGYSGKGDLFVFLFFGILAVCGTYTLYQHQELKPSILLLAAAIGMLSTAVLNLNNMRDMKTDEIAGKKTIPLKIGYKKARIYQVILVLSPFLLTTTYLLINNKNKSTHFLFLLLLIPTTLFLKNLFNTNDPKLLDKELKKIALLTLAFAIIVGTSINL